MPTQKEINHILCAVRGKPEGRDTVTKAIDLALKHRAKLTFVMVIDLDFLGKAAPTFSPVSAMFRRLQDLGEFALLILVDRARRRGVKKVDAFIRTGFIKEELLKAAQETEADLMVLGKPVKDMPGTVFTPEEFDDLIAEIERITSLKVVRVSHPKRRREST